MPLRLLEEQSPPLMLRCAKYREKRDAPETKWPKFFNDIYNACPANHLNLFEPM